MGFSDTNSRLLIHQWLEKFASDSPESLLADPITTSDTMKHWGIAEELYVPSPDLISRINDYEIWCKGRTGENAGNLMEKIVLLAFCSLRGWNAIESYQSYATQHDLVISGSEPNWLMLMIFLHLPPEGRTIVIEAKNLNEPVNDSQFSRMCHILQDKFNVISHLGVFFSRSGATGFNTRRSLRDSRATQVLFHAITKKFVVVLDHEEILQLKQKGSLPYLLEAKIRDIESSSNISTNFNLAWKKINLPEHLAKWMPSTGGSASSTDNGG